MRLPRLTTRRVLVLVGVAMLALGQASSSAYRTYLRRSLVSEEFTLAEGIYRRKANVCEELSPRLREVASLAREMAKSASSDFERKKWLEMALKDEEKATLMEQLAVKHMTRADELASRATRLAQSAWRPWLPVDVDLPQPE